MFKQYRKRVDTINAIQFTPKNIHKLTELGCVITGRSNGTSTCVVESLQGPLVAVEGDYIMRSHAGVLSVCTKEAFENLYVEV